MKNKIINNFKNIFISHARKLVLFYFLLAQRLTCSGSDSNGYLGCFADDLDEYWQRDLSVFGIGTTNTKGGGSIESCIAYCNQFQVLFAGVQNG